MPTPGEATFRPLTEDERAMLVGYGWRPSWLDRLGAPLFATAIVAGLIALAFGILGRWVRLGEGTRLVFGGALVAGTFIWAWRSMARSGPPPEWLAIQARDVERGEAEVSRYEVADAVQVEEFEDEGSNYFLRLRDGRVLFLSGQFLYEMEEARTFPSSVLEVSRSPQGRLVLDVRCTGSYLPPSSTLPPFPESGDVPSHGDVLEVDLDAIRRGETFANVQRG
jgi:hypothetical protein